MAKQAHDFLLRVTAGPSYDESTHTLVHVNGPTATPISSTHCTANVKIRIQNYRGLPHGSPSTSPYFSSAQHTHDQYSIAFTLVPHSNVSGNHLVFGNDFEYPIKDRLPPGFNTAFRIVKWGIDPGLEGDFYADKPYLYGPLLSSINILRIGQKATKKGESWEIPAHVHEDGIEEGGDGDGEDVRKDTHIPEGAAERKKWFLHEDKRKDFEWEAGRIYRGDFFNPYLDFNEFALKLPGFSLSVLGLLNGQDSLRYTLKNQDTGDVFFVVVFTLLPKEDLEKEEATGKEQAAEKDKDSIDHAAEKAQPAGEEEFQPKVDDVD